MFPSFVASTTVVDWLATATINVSLPWSSDSDGSALWLIGPGAGIGFYVFHFLRYRNTHQRHAFERDTHTEVLGMTGHDTLVRRVSGVENSKIPGENSSSPRQRLGQGTRFTEE